jgi:hypothetical protein
MEGLEVVLAEFDRFWVILGDFFFFFFFFFFCDLIGKFCGF